MILAVLCALGVAEAGGGPWVLGPGDQTLYVGMDVQRLTQLGIQAGPNPADYTTIDVGEGLSSFGVKAIANYGILSRVELELELPWYRVSANRTDAEPCLALGEGSCKTTQSIGLIRGQAKWLVLDELQGMPLSVSLGGTLRYGGFTAPARSRITNVGEGTTDLGPSIHLGRSGGLGKSGYWSAYTELFWLYRFPSTDSYQGSDLGPDAPVSAPLPEWILNAEVLFSPDAKVAFGPSASGLYRKGLDWYELNLADPDRLAALGVYNFRVGGKAVIRNERGVAFSTGFLRTVVSYNNPSDAWLVSAGLSVPTGLGRP